MTTAMGTSRLLTSPFVTTPTPATTSAGARCWPTVLGAVPVAAREEMVMAYAQALWRLGEQDITVITKLSIFVAGAHCRPALTDIGGIVQAALVGLSPADRIAQARPATPEEHDAERERRLVATSPGYRRMQAIESSAQRPPAPTAEIGRQLAQLTAQVAQLQDDLAEERAQRETAERGRAFEHERADRWEMTATRMQRRIALFDRLITIPDNQLLASKKLTLWHASDLLVHQVRARDPHDLRPVDLKTMGMRTGLSGDTIGGNLQTLADCGLLRRDEDHLPVDKAAFAREHPGEKVPPFRTVISIAATDLLLGTLDDAAMETLLDRLPATGRGGNREVAKAAAKARRLACPDCGFTIVRDDLVVGCPDCGGRHPLGEWHDPDAPDYRPPVLPPPPDDDPDPDPDQPPAAEEAQPHEPSKVHGHVNLTCSPDLESGHVNLTPPRPAGDAGGLPPTPTRTPPAGLGGGGRRPIAMSPETRNARDAAAAEAGTPPPTTQVSVAGNPMAASHPRRPGQPAPPLLASDLIRGGNLTGKAPLQQASFEDAP
jgi:hypothetical protein